MVVPRAMGRTGWEIYPIGLSTCSLGALTCNPHGGQVLAVLQRALEQGVNLFEISGRSRRANQAFAHLYREHPGEFRLMLRAAAGEVDGEAGIPKLVDEVVKDTGRPVELLLLPAPPYPESSEGWQHSMECLAASGQVCFYGVWANTAGAASQSAALPGIQCVWVPFNMFQQRAAVELFAEARRYQVGVLAGLPLAAGVLAGGLPREGLDRQRLQAVEHLRGFLPVDVTPAQFALRWTLMFEEVTCAVAGARTLAQVEENAQAAWLPELIAETMSLVRGVYQEYIPPIV